MSDRSETSGDVEENDLGGISRIKAKLGFANEKRDVRKTLLKALTDNDEKTQEFSKQERLMLLNTLRFGSTRIEDVMIPRADIVAIEVDRPLTELFILFKEEGHSRIPIYKGTLDDIVGIVHLKDFLNWMAEVAINQVTEPKSSESETKKRSVDLGNVDLLLTIEKANIMREVPYIPASLVAVDLLLRMQATRNHMALVVDEYGGTDGLVTIEDLVEEIVGEIEDEHDDEGEILIEKKGAEEFLASARISIDELETTIKRPLSLTENEEEPHTLGGLVFLLSGHVPIKGEIIAHPNGVEFEVLEADSRKIKRLKVLMKEVPVIEDEPES